MDCSKAASFACQLLLEWSGNTGIPYKEFAPAMDAAYSLNRQIASGEVVVLSIEEHDELIANQKKKPGRK